ncbi:MAG TPA: S8 family peptidase, partial [Ilumatobacteraceae bacterium]
MNELRALVVALAVPTAALLPLGTGSAAVGASRYIVQFDAGVDASSEAARLTALGVEVADTYTNVFPGVAIIATPVEIAQIGASPDVDRIERDQSMSLGAVPATVVQSPPSWGLDRIDQRTLPLSNTYSYNGAGAGVSAYIIDSGIRADHLDFGGRVRSGFTTVLDGHGTDDWCVGHGTHVAGTVGGQVFGVAKNVSLVAVRVLDCSGSTDVAQFVQSLDWVIGDHQPGAPAVANISIGGPPSTAVDNGIQALIADGVTVVVAAGNTRQGFASPDDACTRSPSRAPNALTVAASTEADSRASFSNFGPCVDLFAPGTNIVSDGIASSTATATMNGTSMATPHVAGAAAVLLSERPTWTPAQVARDLLGNATGGGIANTAGSPNRLLFESPITPPVNDDFAAATPIDLAGANPLTGSNIDATDEAGEPAHGPIFGGTSVWWTFVAPSYGDLTLSTEGSTFDTLLAVYSGDSVGGLVPVASNDGPGNGSATTIHAIAGRVYHVAVDGADGAAGSVVLGFTWKPATFVPLVPARLLESRGVGSTVDGVLQGIGVRGAGSVTELLVVGRGGVAG